MLSVKTLMLLEDAFWLDDYADGDGFEPCESFPAPGLDCLAAKGFMELTAGIYRLTAKGKEWGDHLRYICHVPADDALTRIETLLDIEILSACLRMEANTEDRATVLHAIDMRIRKLQKLGRKA